MKSILIKNCKILTINNRREVIKKGFVFIEDGKISNVGKKNEVNDCYRPEKEIDANGSIVMPGLINCHVHLPQMLMRSITDNVTVMDKLTRYTWPIEGNYDEKDVKISSLLGFLEMIKSGTTSLISTGLQGRYGIDNILKEAEKIGLRGVISRYIMEKRGYATEDAAIHEGLQETKEESLGDLKRLIKKWNNKNEKKIEVWPSPRSIGAISVDTMREISDITEENDIGITTHWAEAENNVEYAEKEFDMNMSELAENMGLLKPNVTLAHGIYFREKEIKKLAKSGVNICHCPVCNSKLAMGVAKIPSMLKSNVNVCLGTDGAPVNNTLDMFREMRYTVLLHRINSLNPLFPRTEDVIEMATIKGARALGLDDEIGSIEEGKKADIIIIDIKNNRSVPIHDPVSPIVWTVTGRDVKTTIIDGQIVMEDRKLKTVNESKIIEEVEKIKGKIRTQAGIKIDEKWPRI